MLPLTNILFLCCARANAISLHGPDGFHIRLNPEDRLAVFNSIDVEKADCFKPEDKVTILSEVVQQYGTPQAFNNKLKLQIMLEPLSYRIDVRRLTQRAEASGTVWELGPVREWLGSSRRMLVVVAGAGEGKSTLSAVLATSPETAGLVTAYHFLKHSDNRRTEPIRIIKSLAFQLAERCVGALPNCVGVHPASVLSLAPCPVPCALPHARLLLIFGPCAPCMIHAHATMHFFTLSCQLTCGSRASYVHTFAVQHPGVLHGSAAAAGHTCGADGGRGGGLRAAGTAATAGGGGAVAAAAQGAPARCCRSCRRP